MDETQPRLTTFGQFGIGDIRVFRDTERDDQAAAPHMERGEGRAAFPDQIVEAGQPLPGDRLVRHDLFIAPTKRSEQRRVADRGLSKCISRGYASESQKKI